MKPHFAKEIWFIIMALVKVNRTQPSRATGLEKVAHRRRRLRLLARAIVSTSAPVQSEEKAKKCRHRIEHIGCEPEVN